MMRIIKTPCSAIKIIFSITLIFSLFTSCQTNIGPSNVMVTSPPNGYRDGLLIRKSQNDDRLYESLLLPNNLQVVLVSDPKSENSAASLAVGAGSGQDPESQLGLAHFVEHMLFLGTKQFPIPGSFMEFVQGNGGTTNAFTSLDKTTFMFQLNSSKFDEGLGRFSDYFKAPTFDARYVYKERNAVNSEWSIYKNQDEWILRQIEGDTANPLNAATRFGVGNLTTLADKNNSELAKEAKTFYEKYYSPNNMRLTLVGRQSIPELKELALRHFSSIPNKNIIAPKMSAFAFTDNEMGKIIGYRPVKDLRKIYIDFPMKANKDLWRKKANEYIASLLASEEEGTLNSLLRREGLISDFSIESSPNLYGSDGRLRLKFDLTEKGTTNRDKIVASAFSYIDMVKGEGVDSRYYIELKAVKERAFANQSKQSPIAQAVSITTAQFDYPIQNVLDYGYVFDEFDAPLVMSTLELLKPENARIWYIGNDVSADKDVKFFEGHYSVRKIHDEEYEKWRGLSKGLTFQLPSLNNLITENPAPLVDSLHLQPFQILSQKGVEAFLAHPQYHREDKGVIFIEINTKFADTSLKNYVLGGMLSDIYKSKNVALIDRAERASLGITVKPSENNSQAISVYGYTDKQAYLIDQMITSFAALDISKQEFGESKQKYIQSIVNQKKTASYLQAFSLAARALNNVPWSDNEMLETVTKVSLKDIVNYKEAITEDALLRIYAFGNYTEDQVKQIALSASKKLPGHRLPEKRKIKSLINPALSSKIEQSITAAQPDNAMLHIFIRPKKNDDEAAILVVLNSLFSSSFFNQLRTKEQLGYIVGSRVATTDDYPGFAIYVQSPVSTVNQLNSRMNKFYSEFEGQLVAIDEAKIEEAKSAQIRNAKQIPPSFFAESILYMGDFQRANYNFDSRDRFIASLATVNKNGLLKLYREMLVEGKAMRLNFQVNGTIAGKSDEKKESDKFQ